LNTWIEYKLPETYTPFVNVMEFAVYDVVSGVGPVGPVEPVGPVGPETVEAAPEGPVGPVGPGTVESAPDGPVGPVGPAEPAAPAKLTAHTLYVPVPLEPVVRKEI
jgi:hypothetical protein